jgi:hypothetical protein
MTMTKIAMTKIVIAITVSRPLTSFNFGITLRKG